MPNQDLPENMVLNDISHSNDIDALIRTLTCNRKDQQSIQHELEAHLSVERAIVARLYALRFPKEDKP